MTRLPWRSLSTLETGVTQITKLRVKDTANGRAGTVVALHRRVPKKPGGFGSRKELNRFPSVIPKLVMALQM